MKRLTLSVSGVLLAALTMAATAVAQAPVERVYGGAGGNLGEVQGGATAGGAAGGTLPFTGIDLGLMALAAGLLIATGLIVRRVARAKTASS